MNRPNTIAIEKIIAKEAVYANKKANPVNADGTPKYKTRRPYTLSDDGEFAVRLMEAYLKGKVTEAEYKGWCAGYNMTHIFSDEIEDYVEEQFRNREKLQS